MIERRQSIVLPIAMALLGIGLLSLMDAYMKSASLLLGAYTASLLRAAMAFALIAPVWLAGGGRWPAREVLKIHLLRGAVGSLMALSFFYALTRLPLAETIAISFIAPVISLYLAAAMLGERIRREAVWGAVLGFAGTLVIVAGRLGGEGQFNNDTLLGLAAITVSALLYAWNLVLQRRQALVARPAEVTTFYMGTASLVYLLAAPWLFATPAMSDLTDVAISAVLSVGGAMTMSWAYGRAEAQVLVPLEYSGFLWAALFGWLYFREAVTGSTLAGAALIVLGCWIATRVRPEQSAI